MSIDLRILASMGDRIEWHDSLGSTNDRAREIAGELKERAHGWIVGAEAQSAGRGRKGARWLSDPGLGLTFSVVVAPSWKRGQWGWLSVTAGLAVCAALDGRGLHPEIKWPNDILIGTRKLCGILIETVGELAVIGIGLNVNERSFPDELNAVSLFQLLGVDSGRENLMSAIWAELMVFLSMPTHRIAELAWERLAWRELEVETSTGVRGRIRGFGEDAKLMVESADCLVSLLDADGLRVVDDAV